jgi:hypothetical protein
VLVDFHCRPSSADIPVNTYDLTNYRNVHDQVEFHRRHATQYRDHLMGPQSAGGISNRTDYSPDSEDKDGHNPHFAQCQARATLLWAGETAHQWHSSGKEKMEIVAYSNRVSRLVNLVGLLPFAFRPRFVRSKSEQRIEHWLHGSERHCDSSCSSTRGAIRATILGMWNQTGCFTRIDQTMVQHKASSCSSGERIWYLPESKACSN